MTTRPLPAHKLQSLLNFRHISKVAAALAFALLASALSAPAQTGSVQSGPAAAQARPATTYKVVVDVAQSGDAFDRAIGSVRNLLKALGPDHVTVEVVAHSAGIKLLVAADNANTAELTELAKQGVIFAACENSMRANHLTKADLLPFAVPVDAGVAELVRRQHEGYAYVYIPN